MIKSTHSTGQLLAVVSLYSIPLPPYTPFKLQQQQLLLEQSGDCKCILCPQTIASMKQNHQEILCNTHQIIIPWQFDLLLLFF